MEAELFYSFTWNFLIVSLKVPTLFAIGSCFYLFLFQWVFDVIWTVLDVTLETATAISEEHSSVVYKLHKNFHWTQSTVRTRVIFPLSFVVWSCPRGTWHSWLALRCCPELVSCLILPGEMLLLHHHMHTGLKCRASRDAILPPRGSAWTSGQWSMGVVLSSGLSSCLLTCLYVSYTIFSKINFMV